MSQLAFGVGHDSPFPHVIRNSVEERGSGGLVRPIPGRPYAGSV